MQRSPYAHGPPEQSHSSSMQQQQQQQQPAAAAAAAAAALPGIQHFQHPYGVNGAHEHHQHHHHQEPQPPQQHHAPYPSIPYAYPNGAMPPAAAVPSVNGQAMMRYPIPQTPLDSRQMSGGRHKKEIKRRTKTGCLTCRKRRIKCDEGHPTCGNCRKSKRECLGYDPIFKQAPSPNIQPAPNAPPPQAPATHPSAPPTLPTNQYPTPHAFPGAAGSFIQNRGPHPGEEQPYGPYSTSLDPALAGGDSHSHMARNNYAPTLQAQRKVRHIDIDALFWLNRVAPEYIVRMQPPPVSPAIQSEIEAFYKLHYAVGLDRLFETQWYSQRGMTQLQRDPTLQDFVLQCAEQMKAKAGTESAARSINSLEARLVWVLAAMPRATASDASNASADPMTQELLPRIDTVEKLLTGQFLDPSQVPPPPQQPPPSQPNEDSSPANQKYIELSFWHHLGRFVTLRDDQPDALKDVNDALTTVRRILNMLENRDVLYSIAIARHIGGRMPDFDPERHLLASSNDSEDEVNKLKVAQQFVESEDQRGTTQVIQRVCSMALRGWVLQTQGA